MADAKGAGLERRNVRRNGKQKQPRLGEIGRAIEGNWLPEPGVGRVAHGVPRRVDRLKALGNAVVPQVVEQIGRAILVAEQ